MSTVHFHPVWEQQLTKTEKDYYIQRAQSIHLTEQSLTITPVTTKYKRNGGIVTTVFLHNGYSQPLQLPNQFVKILDQHGEVIAQGDFLSPLTIAAESSQPWSFVFSKQMTVQPDADLTTIDIFILGEDME